MDYYFTCLLFNSFSSAVFATWFAHADDASLAQLESALRARLPRVPRAALRSAIDALVADSRIYETDTNVYRALAGGE